MADWELFARCARGFEKVLADELRGLRMKRVRPQVGAVAFFGSLEDAYRACLWSRVATRVQLVLGRVSARDAEALYAGVRNIAWESHVLPGATIAVRAHGTNASLRNTQFTALKAKDALCDRLRDVRGERPSVDASNPDFTVDVALHESRATVCLNVSGPSLHRRGYREDGVQTAAPLKETLAAGMLLATGWPELAREGGMLVDPMCGSGTIAVEAALIAAGIAPGLLRDRWGFEGWAQHDASLWERVLAKAREQAEVARLEAPRAPCVLAGDISEDAIAIARANVKRAGVASYTQVFCDDAARIGRHLRGILKRGARDGMIATNPPYGERLGTREDLPHTNAALVAAVDALPAGWRVALITPDVSIDTALGRIPTWTLDCNNGPIDVRIRMYDLGVGGAGEFVNGSRGSGAAHLHDSATGSRPGVAGPRSGVTPREDAPDLQSTAAKAHKKTEPTEIEVVSLTGTQRRVRIANEHSTQFAARLRKVARERVRRARKQSVAGLRVYEADVPEYPFVVDVYFGAFADDTKRYAIVYEQRRRTKGDEQDAARRLFDACAIVAAVLDVPAENVLVRSWRQGLDSSTKGDAHQRIPLWVRENDMRFCIDLAGKPDTGLSPAWHDVRMQAGESAKGKSVLNLGDATMAATVHAANGGAARTTTVVEYPDRAEWLRDTLHVNGFGNKRHKVICEDVAMWAKRAQREGRTFDLVICSDATQADIVGTVGTRLVLSDNL